MRIDGMDAAFRSQVTYTQTENRADIPTPIPVKVQGQIEEFEPVSSRVNDAFIKKAVEKANKTMQEHGRSLEFKIHEKTHDIIVKVIDTDTKEVIREIPSEKMLDMFANMLELAGLIVDERR